MPKLVSINPFNNSVLGEVEISSENEISKKIANAHLAKDKWQGLGVDGRVKLLRKVIKVFRERKEEVARLASSEMGMPIVSSREDVDSSMDYFEWYLDNAEKYLSPEVVYEDKKIRHTVYREPIGVSANITPWNFPTSNFVWSVAQSLVSGNTVVIRFQRRFR